jgi:hypothetical protein
MALRSHNQNYSHVQKAVASYVPVRSNKDRNIYIKNINGDINIHLNQRKKKISPASSLGHFKPFPGGAKPVKFSD